MVQEPLTLYKLIVLYMLNRVNFPMTAAQVSEIILEKEYTSFLTLQQVLNELEESGLVSAKTLVNRTHLQITTEGRATLSYFENRISDAIKEDIREYLKKNVLEMRIETSIQGTYYKAVSGEFAVSICDNWQKRNKEIYQYLTSALF